MSIHRKRAEKTLSKTKGSEKPNHNISTYKSILEMIENVEREEDNFKRARFLFLTICFSISILIFIGYCMYKGNIYVIAKEECIGLFLIPIFNYLFKSYEDSIIKQRKAEILKACIELFGPTFDYTRKVSDSTVSNEDAKGIVMDKIKSYL